MTQMLREEKKSENKILVIKKYVFTMLHHLPNDFPVKNRIGKIRQLLVSIFRRQPNLKQEVRKRKFESSKSKFNQGQLFLELIAGGSLKYTQKFIKARRGFLYIRHVPSKKSSRSLCVKKGSSNRPVVHFYTSNKTVGQL